MNGLRIFDGETILGDLSKHGLRGWLFHPNYKIRGRYMSKRYWPTAWDAIPKWAKDRATHGVPDRGHSKDRLTISEIKTLPV